MLRITESANLMTNLAQIMEMIWKRLQVQCLSPSQDLTLTPTQDGDKKKLWRHTYKALQLIDNLLKSGHESCNTAPSIGIAAHLDDIRALTDFKFYDEHGKDVGLNIRERAKAIIALLADTERLKYERVRASNSRSRMEAGNGTGGTAGGSTAQATCSPSNPPPSMAFEHAKAALAANKADEEANLASAT